jgi:cytochrome b561
MMAFSYFILALCLAVTLNLGNRFVRALGTVLAACSLFMMVYSIFLADIDGTFAHAAASGGLEGRLTPLVLNIQGAVGTAGILFLLWAAWRQWGRRGLARLPIMNGAVFGLVSRYAHWVIAVIILTLIPMGMFMAVLPASSPDRAGFVATHESLGALVLVLVALRLAWLRRSPPPGFDGGLRPWERRLAHAVHIGLYSLILAFPLTGLLLGLSAGAPLPLFGFLVPALWPTSPAAAGVLAVLHNQLLPLLFYTVIFAHVGAVLKHHFVDGRVNDVRRMLR